MASSTIEASESAERTLAAPRMLHHTAYVTHDVTGTVDFYVRVLKMKLISAVIDDAVPSTGDPFPYIHLFFEMKDGSSVAFFESLDLPPPAPISHPAYGIFNHLALEVEDRDEVDQWAKHLRAEGVDVVGPVDHGIIYSVYFYDPNGIRLELTTDLDVTWKNHGEKAAADVTEWAAVKKKAAIEGGDVAVAWIKSRRAEHKTKKLAGG